MQEKLTRRMATHRVKVEEWKPNQRIAIKKIFLPLLQPLRLLEVHFA